MKARAARAMKSLLLLFLSLLAAFVAEQWCISKYRVNYERVMGMNRDNGLKILSSPYTVFDTVEYAPETEGAQPMTGWVEIGKDSSLYRTDVVIYPESVSAIMINARSSLSLSDTDGDKEYDAVAVRLGNKNDDNAWYEYQDFNRDGTIDQIRSMKNNKAENCLVRIGWDFVEAGFVNGGGEQGN